MTFTVDGASSALDRFSDPLYTFVEVGRYLDVPAAVVGSWAKGDSRHGQRPKASSGPVLTTVGTPGRGPVVPFVGLAEGVVLTGMRRAGVPMHHIRSGSPGSTMLSARRTHKPPVGSTPTALKPFMTTMPRSVWNRRARALIVSWSPFARTGTDSLNYWGHT